MSTVIPSTLTAVQRVAKRCLAEIDRVCTLLDIRYVAYGGMTVGAVRHRGLIPWDDDGDVRMSRADYKRFVAEAPTLFEEEFFIAFPTTHPDYPADFGVLGLKGLEFVPKVAEGRSFRMPIGVDLFVLGEIVDDPGRLHAQSRGTWPWARLIFLRSIPSPPTGLPTPARQLASAATACVHWGMRALRVGEASLYRRWLHVVLKGRKNPQKTAGGSILFGDFSVHSLRRWSVFEAKLLLAHSVPFEDITVHIPTTYDVALMRDYGGYMRTPDPQDRVIHEPFHIILGPNDPGLDTSEEADT